MWPSSSEVTVYLGNQPDIEHSGLVRLLPGELVNFEARASGSNPTFRWYRDGEPLSDGGGLHGSATRLLEIDGADRGLSLIHI